MRKMLFRHMFMFIFMAGFPVLSFALECTYREDVEPDEYYINKIRFMQVFREHDKQNLTQAYKNLEPDITEYMSKNNDIARLYFINRQFTKSYTYDCHKKKCDYLDINNSISYCESILNSKCSLIAVAYKKRLFCTTTTELTTGKFDPFKENE